MTCSLMRNSTTRQTSRWPTFSHRTRALLARALRTAPPPGVAGVERLSFSGSQPFVRPVPHDAALPEGLNLTLYAFTPFQMWNVSASAVPSVAFTLVPRTRRRRLSSWTSW